MNRLGRVFGLEEEKLSNNNMSSVVVNRTVDANNALFEKTGEDIIGSFATGRVLDNHGDETVSASVSGFRDTNEFGGGGEEAAHSHRHGQMMVRRSWISREFEGG
ncbi:hypothetical protein M5689_021017 [Euphorbia peplus]|nr:hypothetical protein M5689_021017 [Euphorbia peplus]